MRKNIRFLFYLLLLIPFVSVAQGQKKPVYEAGTVVFKLKKQHATTGTNARQHSSPSHATIAENIKKDAGAAALTQPFSHLTNEKNAKTVQGQEASVLDGIFKLELPQGASVEDAVALLRRYPEVEYAEPYYLPELLEVPNDPHYSRQSYLPLIQAPAAWDIQKGSRDIIIAILDTGVDFNHPDLKANLHYNVNDTIDGIDNDNDGFVDNYRGWDFANYDNNPTADGNAHGTYVTGMCSASVNNAAGIAGTGYNSSYMPIKVFNTRNNRFSNGYEAIVYAANKGCHVINLSWGAAGAPSEYVQDIITYAVVEKNAVVVAAAGNTAAELDFYPASYDNVLSVSSSELNDQKSAWATWSRFVDVVTPGSVFTTTNGGGYTGSAGTSFGTPQVAGLAALVRAQFPSWTAQQVMEHIRRSADDIMHLGTNITYQYRLGNGRINMLKALQPPTGPAVRMNNFDYSNGSGRYAFHSDTVQLWMDFTNYLAPTSGVTVKLVAESAYVTVLDNEISLGSLATLQSTSTQQLPFRIRLHENLPALALLSFRLEFSGEGYQDYQYFQLRTSGEYIDFTVDDLTLTVASNGNLGYNYDYNLQGLGLRYQNAPLAHNMGLVIAQNPTAVANNAIYYANPALRDQDFKTTERLRLYQHSLADVDARSSFEVVTGDSTKLNLLINQKILGWTGTSGTPAVVLEYRIINRSDTAYNNLNVGLFADFNLHDFFINKADWDATHQLGYTYDEQQERYAGVALLSGQPLLYHATDIGAREGNQSEFETFLTRKQKWSFVSKGISKEKAGAAGRGNDVAKFMGGTIPSLGPNMTDKVVFVLVTAPSLQELQAATESAKQQYLLYKNTPTLLAKVETCYGTAATLLPKPGSRYRFYATKAADAALAEGESFTTAPLEKDTVFYVQNIDAAWAGELERIEVLINNISADFTMSADTLWLNAGTNETLTLSAQGPTGTSWLWDFGNGYLSTLQQPSLTYTSPGSYTISLKATDAKGCSTSILRTLVVIRKEIAPVANDLQLCMNAQGLIQEVNGRTIHVYADEALQQLLYSGLHYTTEPLTESKTYYLTTGSGLEESLPTAITAHVFQASVTASYALELATESQYALTLSAQASPAEAGTHYSWYINEALAGTGAQLTISYNAQVAAPHVRLVATFENGCATEFQQQLPLTQAAAPQLQNLFICKGATALVEPQQEGIYYFYADAALTNLLHKGRALTLTNIWQDSTVYVTNLTGGLESSATPLIINVPDALAAFSLPENAGVFEEGLPLNFQSNSVDATNWLWNFGDGTTSTEQHPVHTYQSAGTYTVTLTAQTSAGCTETEQKELVLAAPQGIGRDQVRKLQLFPNPTAGSVRLQLPEQLQAGAQVVVLDAAGRQVVAPQQLANDTTARLELEHLPAGLYIVRIMNGMEVWQARVVKH